MPYAIPNTRTRLSHALVLRAGGRVIGAVHTWNVDQARTLDTEYEVDVESSGDVAEIIPQALGAISIRLGRYDLYSKIMEEVFGDDEIINLTDQTRPFALEEVWTSPAASLFGSAFNITQNRSAVFDPIGLGGFNANLDPTELPLIASTLLAGGGPKRYRYVGCWFQSIGRTLSTTGDRMVSVDAQILAMRKEKVI